MNAALAAMVWLLQKVPLPWRRPVGKISRLRAIADRIYPQGPGVFPLAKPLEGRRMRLEWKSRKGFVFGTWEPRVVDAICRLVQPGQVALDVGAHMGYFTLLLAKQVGPSGMVIAFEPNPRIFEILRENVTMNGCLNVTLENKAVADRAGLAALRLNNRLPLEGLDSIVPDPGSGPEVEVPTVRLDDYFGSGVARVDFAKIDIEGAEMLALDGMSTILQRDRPTLVIELHRVEGRIEDHDAVLRLERTGYQVSVLDFARKRGHILAQATVSRA